MTPRFISIQGSYVDFEVALFEGASLLATNVSQSQRASAQLIVAIDAILKEHRLLLSDLDFIAIDLGPGAFTSLRATLTMVNGIAFASAVPLIGVDGLVAITRDMQEEFATSSTNTSVSPLTVALLNAFNKEVYFRIGTSQPQSGYEKISSLLERIKELEPQRPILLGGNGAQLYCELIEQQLGERVLILSSFPSVASARSVGLCALEQWRFGKKGVDKVLPLYLKTQAFQKKL